MATDRPMTFEADGLRVVVTTFDDDHRSSLRRMYEDYPLEHRTLGLPRVLGAALDAWLDEVLEAGANFVALVDGTVAGHAVYAPVDADEADFVVFVDPDHFGLGLGTALLEYAIRHAARAGVDRIVSHVAATNARALHVYDKVGFERLEDEGLVVTVGIEPADADQVADAPGD